MSVVKLMKIAVSWRLCESLAMPDILGNRPRPFGFSQDATHDQTPHSDQQERYSKSAVTAHPATLLHAGTIHHVSDVRVDLATGEPVHRTISYRDQ